MLVNKPLITIVRDFALKILRTCIVSVKIKKLILSVNNYTFYFKQLLGKIFIKSHQKYVICNFDWNEDNKNIFVSILCDFILRRF